MSQRPFLLAILIGLLLLLWAMPVPHSSQPVVPASGHGDAVALSQASDLPSTVTDAEGRFIFPSVPLATHLVYLLENTLPARWQTDLAQTPVRLTLNPGTTKSGRVTSWVVLEARYQDDAIAGVVFADLDQDGQMGAGDVGLAGVTVIDPGVHQYFVPFNDRDLWQLFSEINRCQAAGYVDVSDTLESVISLTASEDNTEWFYDHWEDGYDADPLSPGPTTETGTLSAGLTQNFPQTVDTTDLGNPGNLQYDGRDRITLHGHPGPMTRIMYPSIVEGIPGVVLATAWEVPEVLNWGDRYIATLGEDLDFNGAFVDDFDYTGLEVTAVEPGTEVYYNGALVATLGPGGTYPVYGANDGPDGGGVDSDDVITANAPIQVQSFVGGCDMAGGGWSAQGFTLMPVSEWGNEYWAPAPDFTEGVGGCNIDLDGGTGPPDDRDVDIYVHNSDDTDTTVTLNIPGSAFDGTVIPVPAHSTQSVLGVTGWGDLPPDADNTQAIRLTSAGNIWALSMVDSSTAGVNEPRVNDWGYSLVPLRNLSSQVILGWAPGNNDVPPSDNGNLAFVTAVVDTVVFVDLDQDGAPDNFDMNGDGDADDAGVYGIAAFDETTSAAGVPLIAGQVLRVGDPFDEDLGGALIYTEDLSHKIAAAWGQDACAAGRASPYLDLGYTPLAVGIPRVDKESDLAVDADDSGDISAGDTLVYTVTMENNGFGDMFNVVLTDRLPHEYVDFVLGSIETSLPYTDPPGIEYDDGSDTFGYTPPGAPGTTDATITAFRLTWAVVGGRATITTTFDTVIQDDIPVGVSEMCNFAEVTSEESEPVEADTCRFITQQEPTPTFTPTTTPTATPTATGTPPTPTPTVTGTPPTPTPTVTGTPPTPTPTVTGTPPTPTPTTTGTTAKAPPGEIPEPLTLVLMGSGLAALAGYARLRRR